MNDDLSGLIDEMSPEEKVLVLEYFTRDREEFLYAAGEARKRFERADGYRAEPPAEGGLERHPASYTYDPEAGAAYIYLDDSIPPGGVARTIEVDATVHLDYSLDGRIVGIEILGAWPEAPTAPFKFRWRFR